MMRRPRHGPLLQVAYIVDDIDAAIDFWTGTMGVGPFFVFPPLDAVSGDYRGRDHLVRIEAAVAYSGDLMIELIRPLGPSIFQEFRDRGGSGVQHLCAFTDDFDATERDLYARGARRLQGTGYADGSQIAYYAMDDEETVILEIAFGTIEVLALFDAVKTAGAAWDGTTRTISF